ncbi:hypothetical protein Leryth_025386 [Lithospermum erythrorhizon]|nr:hypothetical protein Leryth_025386 [Lithospermum erythrorhizon]
MANSKYQSAKSFEMDDEVMAPNIIVVRIGGRNFDKFSEVHEFAKPNDEQALKLMNACAKAVLEENGFHEIAFAYGFSDEYSFVFKKDTEFYQRRGSKILSLIVSLFTSKYVEKWKEFFPQKDIRYPPSFHSRVVSCASLEVLQSYLTWRQKDCHDKNQYATCFWELIRRREYDREKANGILKNTQKQQKHDLLFKEFEINYKELPDIFRQGSFVLKQEVEEITKYGIDGTPVKRMRRKVTTVHSKNVTSRSFWSTHPYLLKELGEFEGDICKIKPEFMKSFQFENKLLPSTWIVIRIDGCHFHKFSDIHDFEKPNDTNALNLMNSCAMAVVEEFNDVVFAYGVSDEYSFVLKKDSQFYGRRPSEIVSVITSFFTSVYVMKWKECFLLTKLKLSPYFDGRAICYPSKEILLDYLAWRQVDCHINNQYNTCFWMLVKSGMTKTKAQEYLKGTQTQEKNKLLNRFGIDYNTLPIMFRQGSSVFWGMEESTTNEMEGVTGISVKKVVVDYINIIDKSFWYDHPHILGE